MGKTGPKRPPQANSPAREGPTGPPASSFSQRHLGAGSETSGWRFSVSLNLRFPPPRMPSPPSFTCLMLTLCPLRRHLFQEAPPDPGQGWQLAPAPSSGQGETRASATSAFSVPTRRPSLPKPQPLIQHPPTLCYWSGGVGGRVGEKGRVNPDPGQRVWLASWAAEQSDSQAHPSFTLTGWLSSGIP